MEREKDQNLEMIKGYAGKLMFEADRNEFMAFCLDIMAGLVEEGDVITMIKSFDRLRRPILNNGFQRCNREPIRQRPRRAESGA